MGCNHIKYGTNAKLPSIHSMQFYQWNRFVWKYVYSYQWRIQDFPRGGVNLQGGREHAKFSRKLHEIERIWDAQGGACVPHAPPRSANAYLIQYVSFVNLKQWDQFEIKTTFLSKTLAPGPDQASCTDTQRVISSSWLCDGIKDCSDKSDETHEDCSEYNTLADQTGERGRGGGGGGDWNQGCASHLGIQVLSFSCNFL